MIVLQSLSINDIATAVSLILSTIVAIYAVRDYRRRIGKPTISNFENPNYYFRTDKGNTVFEIELEFANNGRESVYITGAKAELADYDYETDFINWSDANTEVFDKTRLDEMDRKEDRLKATLDKELNTDGEPIDVLMRIDTSHGELSKTIEFSTPETASEIWGDTVHPTG